MAELGKLELALRVRYLDHVARSLERLSALACEVERPAMLDLNFSDPSILHNVIERCWRWCTVFSYNGREQVERVQSHQQALVLDVPVRKIGRRSSWPARFFCHYPDCDGSGPGRKITINRLGISTICGCGHSLAQWLKRSTISGGNDICFQRAVLILLQGMRALLF